jgi:iron complex outermembrane recepter protein
LLLSSIETTLKCREQMMTNSLNRCKSKPFSSPKNGVSVFKLKALQVALLGLYAGTASVAANAQTTIESETIVITGTRIEQSARSLPMAIDRIDSDTLRGQNLQVNLSESLQGVPGLNIQSRSNYAQDLQVSSRGFGGRASFGVRGIRMYSDSIPATAPDGSGQLSHFSIGTADRVEVLRGPFSVLYGNASGGVIQIFTEDAPKQPIAKLGLASGSFGTSRYSLNAAGTAGSVGLVGEYSSFATDGFRSQSAADKDQFNFKMSGALGNTKLSFIANSVKINAQDPSGLTRAQFETDPYQTTATAIQFNTRKTTDQTQFGVKVEHAFSSQHRIDGVIYSGERSVVTFQSIPVATQTAATQPGGVIDFDRTYSGIDLRYTFTANWGNIIVGVNRDGLKEDRRGYENFVGTTLGVIGRLRRDEVNHVNNQDVYAQAQYKPSNELLITAGVRNSKVKFTSADAYIIPGRNPDDSGAVNFSKTTPALGASYAASSNLNIYSSVGRGFETPTLNELAYRPSGLTGLNLALKPAVSDSIEVGAKWRAGSTKINAAIFQTKTENEIVTLTNAGGRSTFKNAGATRRNGFELSLASPVTNSIDVMAAFTQLNAKYAESFLTCIAAPCTTANVSVPAGNLLPGVPKQSAFVQARWSHASGFTSAIEVKHQGSLEVNDLNTDRAAAYTQLNVNVGYRQQIGQFTLSGGVRIENIANKRFASSVIVNEGNSRFFESAPGRNWLANLQVSYQF